MCSPGSASPRRCPQGTGRRLRRSGCCPPRRAARRRASWPWGARALRPPGGPARPRSPPRAGGHLDDGPARRFGRERPGLAMDHVQPRPLRLAPPDEVERHPRTEARGAYPQAGEAHRICHAPAEGGPEDRREARRRVDDPGPAMREAQVLELRERLEKVSGEKPVRGRALLERDVDAIAEVVDGVVPAPQDAIVRRTAVVMELVARVADALVLPPAKAFQPLGPEGLGDENVGGDREEPAAQPAPKA